MTAESYQAIAGMSTAARADTSILSRQCAALRILRILQAWASRDGAESGRGVAWVIRHHLESVADCARTTLWRALRKLESSGWIRPSVVVDDRGVEREGYEIAMISASGFFGAMAANETEMKPICTEMKHRNNYINKENQTRSGGGAVQMATHEPPPPAEEAPRASPRPAESDRPRSVDGRRDLPYDREAMGAAKSVAAYERRRRSEHPRAADGDESRWPPLEHSTRAVYRLLAERMRGKHRREIPAEAAMLAASVDLTFERARRHESTWDYWVGLGLWEGSTPSRLLGWLEEPKNAMFLSQAAGKLSAGRSDSRGDPSAHPVWAEISAQDSREEFFKELVECLHSARKAATDGRVSDHWNQTDLSEAMMIAASLRGIRVEEVQARSWSVDFMCTHGTSDVGDVLQRQSTS